MTGNEHPEPKELRRCFKHLCRTYGWRFGFKTTTFHDSIEMSWGSTARADLVLESVSMTGSLPDGKSHRHVGDYGYIAFTKASFPTIDDALARFRTYFEEKLGMMSNGTPGRYVISNSLALDDFHKDNDVFENSNLIDGLSKSAIREAGLKRLYDVLTDERLLIFSQPLMSPEEGSMVGHYLNSPLPKFKTLSELRIKLDMSDFKVEPYEFELKKKKEKMEK